MNNRFYRLLALTLCLGIMLLWGGCSASRETAQTILEQTGLDVDVAPDGAADIAYRTLRIDTDAENLTVAECAFTLDGITYCYRTAATGMISDQICDLTQSQIPEAQTEDTMVGWCDAQISYTADGSGKIIWFDVVPGLVYSLEMDTGASADALLAMAQTVYTPAQGDVG